jgi:ubiquinone/menaquinone biosynthesis C-methylase UbiE
MNEENSPKKYATMDWDWWTEIGWPPQPIISMTHGETIVSRFISLPWHGRVLDLGCNVSPYYSLLKHPRFADVEYYGIDQSRKIIERARKFYPDADGCFIHCRAQDLSSRFTRDFFDCVLASRFFWIFNEGHKSEVLQQVRMVHKEAGMMVVGTDYFGEKAAGKDTEGFVVRNGYELLRRSWPFLIFRKR